MSPGPKAIAAASALALAGSGCTTPGFVIQQPANGSTVPCSPTAGLCSVPVVVKWTGATFGDPDLVLDGQPAMPISGGTGSVQAFPGAHSLVVSGLLVDGVVPGAGTKMYSATSSFTISPPAAPPGGIALTLAPPSVLVERTKSATIGVSAARTPPFAGAIALSATGLPGGVTIPNGLSIPAGQTSANLTLSAGTSAHFGRPYVTIRGAGIAADGSTLTDQEILTLVVGRTSGAFSEADPAPYTNASTMLGASLSAAPSISSKSGSLQVKMVSPPGSGASTNVATFFGGGAQLAAVQFTIGAQSSLAGAGFCNDVSSAALARGVVVSGQLGSSSQNTVTFVRLDSSPYQQWQRPLDSRSSAGDAVQPKIYFSPDCSLALVASANPNQPAGGPPGLLTIHDLNNGNQVREMSFSNFPVAARLVTSGATQTIELDHDGHTERIILSP